ncbi:MAG: hypothetical protein CML94_01225 [Rhodobiaceae bacterium]|nr:hypothetical protein [Rhodobiaceae bacterium]|tara:strand:- start:8211 stop:8735 length:525 start_codon:yes stop_codon:yes gene_type:complete
MKSYILCILFILFLIVNNQVVYANKISSSWASLKYNKTYLRTGPSKDNKVIWVYKRKGLPLKILRKKNEWNEVLLPSNQKGWINSSQISEKRNVIIQNNKSFSEIALSKQKQITITDKNSKPIAHVQDGVIAAFKNCKEDLCKIELKVKKEKYFFKSSYKLSGYIKKEYIWGVN